MANSQFLTSCSADAIQKAAEQLIAGHLVAFPTETVYGLGADATNTWTEKWKSAEVPAANGHGNAKSVARVQSILTSGGEVDGHRAVGHIGGRV